MIEPREFKWVIKDRLAVSCRIGGSGIQHRRVRRDEELAWLRDQGITAVLSLLASPHNLEAYRAAGFQAFHLPVSALPTPEEAAEFYEVVRRVLKDRHARLLIHREFVDEGIGGLLASYLVRAGYLADPVVVADTVQRIVGRPLSPEARRIIPVG